MRKAAVIGAGFISGFHANAYHSMADTVLCAVCDTDAERAAALAKQYGCRAYTDARELLETERPELVSVCLPTFLHAEYACLALRMGAHVLCEKPMALRLEDCEKMAQTAQACGKVLMIGQVLRFWPENVTLREEMRRMGVPHYITACRLQHSSRNGAHQSPEVNGGALFDLFIHDLDYIVSLYEEAPVLMSANGAKGEEGSWRRVNVSLRFPHGPFVQLEACNMMPAGFPFTVSFRAEYPRSALSYSFRTAVNIGLNAESESSLLRFEEGAVFALPVHPDAQAQAFKNEISAFVKGAADGVSPIPPEQSLRVMRLVHEIKNALEQGSDA